MGELHLTKIDTLAFAPKLQQRNQSSIEDESLLDVGVAVVEHLRQEAIHPLEGAHVVLEQEQRLYLVLRILGGLIVFLLSCGQQAASRVFELPQQTIRDGRDGRNEVTLLGLRVQSRQRPHDPPRSSS